MTLTDLLTTAAAALLGILVGAVVNALADDLPHRRTPQLPHYPNGAPRPVLAWSGLLAFLTGQREGPPIELPEEEEKAQGLSLEQVADLLYNTQLSWRYPITELAMAGLFAFITIYEFSDPRPWIWFIFLGILMLITVIDLEHRLILFVVIIPAVIITLILNGLFPETPPNGTGTRSFQEYLWGGVLGGVVFFVMFLGGGVFVDIVAAIQRRAMNEVAFGFGDVMLATLCGFMLGWRVMIFAMFIAVFAGAAGAILYMLYRLLAGRRYQLYTALPYGPYIAFGTVVMMLFLDELRAYFQ
jgi:prepilin signal peptidase PulO-like enzyme (type II secretory pathway)